MFFWIKFRSGQNSLFTSEGFPTIESALGRNGWIVSYVVWIIEVSYVVMVRDHHLRVFVVVGINKTKITIPII